MRPMTRPIKAYWVLPPIKGSRCVDEGTSNLPISIVNTVCDLIVTVTPIPIVMKLQMPIRQRIGVVILLSLGLVVTIAGVMRNVYIYKSLIGTYDETWYAYPLWISTLVELDLAVVCTLNLWPHSSNFHSVVYILMLRCFRVSYVPVLQQSGIYLSIHSAPPYAMSAQRSNRASRPVSDLTWRAREALRRRECRHCNPAVCLSSLG